jgi:predicted ATPase
MWIRQLDIENFRGIKRAQVDFGERQTVLVGPNGAGKSTVLETFALLFGRDRLVRMLTEHDFYGSNPEAGDRIRLIATMTGFSSNIAAEHSQWFSERRGVPKWLTASTGKLLPEPQSPNDALCVQIGFCARFDRTELNVETIRYFHDDDAISDPFDEEVVQTVPARLLPEIGFFLVPAHRTWDRLVSFNSELFRRILESSGSLESAEVLAERDRLRSDEHRVDLQGVLKELREGIDAQLKQLVPGSPGLELRLTATDTDSLLQALVPHYRYADSVSLPAGRHGSGLLSLQTALLVLQIAERRRKANQNVIIAVEEPELHMPPGVQTQVLQRLRNSSNQLVCTTHSPRVAAVCHPTDIRIVNPAGTALTTVVPMLKAALPGSAKNGVRKLFLENRQSFVEALMHRFVLVPFGHARVLRAQTCTGNPSCSGIFWELIGPPTLDPTCVGICTDQYSACLAGVSADVIGGTQCCASQDQACLCDCPPPNADTGNPGPACPTCSLDSPAVADPVDAASGLFLYDHTDLQLKDVMPIELSRSYRELDEQNRAFGIGMALGYDLTIIVDESTSAVAYDGNSYTVPNYAYADLILPNGRRVYYPRISAGNYFEGACQFLGLLNEVLIDGRSAPPVTAIAELIWRIADDYVEFHFEDLLGVPGMNEAVGVGFEFSAPCVVFLVCSAEFAAPILPGVLNARE